MLSASTVRFAVFSLCVCFLIGQVGRVVHECCSEMSFKINDAHDDVVLRIVGPSCMLKLQGEYLCALTFIVVSSGLEVEIGRVSSSVGALTFACFGGLFAPCTLHNQYYVVLDC